MATTRLGLYGGPLAALGPASSVDALLANDLASVSSVTVVAIGQVHSLAATSVSSQPELSVPSLTPSGATHELLADDLSVVSSVSSPAIGQLHVLLATGVQAISTLTIGVSSWMDGVMTEDEWWTYRRKQYSHRRQIGWNRRI